MSSVLKALRDQSSPLLQQPAAIWLSSAPTRQPQRWRWWLTALVLMVAVLSGYWSWQRTLTSPLTSTVTKPVNRSNELAKSYQLGSSQAIRVPSWSTNLEVLPETQQQLSEQNQQIPPPTTTPQTPPRQQGVDLQQVSPELLAAFEQAVAEQAQPQGQPQSADRQSVLPAIGQLARDVQRQIPSFSYDSHQYSSRTDARSVTFSGQRLVEGDAWQGLTILQITPTHVVLSRNMMAFQQPALEDWTRP